MNAVIVASMRIKTLRELRDRAPFMAFDLHLSNGQSLTVVSTDHLFFFPTHAELMVVLPDGAFRFVDPSHVVSAGPHSRRVTK